MNIYAEEGHKVIFDHPNAGTDHDQKVCREKLKVGEIYTVVQTEVGGWHTDVWLKDIKGSFNSVMFSDLPKEMQVDLGCVRNNRVSSHPLRLLQLTEREIYTDGQYTFYKVEDGILYAQGTGDSEWTEDQDIPSLKEAKYLQVFVGEEEEW